MSDTSKREELIEEAAKAIYGATFGAVPASFEPDAFEDWKAIASAALSVFEQAHTPTSDEGEELLLEKIKTAGHVMSEGMIYPYSSYLVKAIPYTRFLDMLAGFRRTAVQEPTTHDRDDMGICRQCGHGITARDVLDGEKPCAASSTATRDALIEGVKLDAQNSMRSDPRVWHEALEAALDKVLPPFWDAALTAAYETKGEGR